MRFLLDTKSKIFHVFSNLCSYLISFSLKHIPYVFDWCQSPLILGSGQKNKINLQSGQGNVTIKIK
jgi:hypothetical protein